MIFRQLIPQCAKSHFTANDDKQRLDTLIRAANRQEMVTAPYFIQNHSIDGQSACWNCIWIAMILRPDWHVRRTRLQKSPMADWSRDMHKNLFEIKERFITGKIRELFIELDVWLFIPEFDILFVAIDWAQCSFERTTTARRCGATSTSKPEIRRKAREAVCRAKTPVDERRSTHSIKRSIVWRDYTERQNNITILSITNPKYGLLINNANQSHCDTDHEILVVMASVLFPAYFKGFIVSP